MLEAFATIFYLTTIVAVGRATLSLLPGDGERGSIETASLSILLGCGMVPSAMFLLASLGAKPRRWEIVALLAVSAAVLYARRGNRGGRPEDEARSDSRGPRWEIEWNRETLAVAVCAAAALAGLAIVFVHATLMPAFDVDAYGHWGLKAKVLYHEGLSPSGFFQRLPLSYSHLNYPLLVPFLGSGAFAALGRVDDSSWRVVFPLFYAGGILFAYSSLRWKLSAVPAAILAAAFATAPATIRWAGSGLADFPLAAFHAVSIFHLVKYLEERKPGDFAVSALATAFCAFTKNEGLALAALNAAVFACAVAALTAPYLVWRSGVPNTQVENYTGRLFAIFEKENLERLFEILRLFAAEMFSPRRWGILWFLAPVAVALNPSAFKQRRVLAMWALLLGHLALYVMVFVISPWSPQFLADMALDRIIIHVAPALLYILAFHMEYPAADKRKDTRRETDGTGKGNA